MKFLNSLFLSAVMALVAAVPSEAAVRYAGGDISLLPEYDKSTYFAPDGTRVADFLSYSAEQGLNCMRVRLFVNPANYKGSDKDPNAKQDIDYIIPICRRIKEAGCELMLDFHYSDTWADPVKQWTPADWVGLGDADLNSRIYSYTKEALEALAEAGIVPDLIQTGNEISYGMLWGAYDSSSSSLKKVHVNNDANWSRFISLLQNAVKACREVCPEARVVIHTERVAQPWYLQQFYTRLAGLDYDVIGLSYYPYFHGSLSVLDAALSTLEADFPGKEIMVVETGYSYAWSVENPVSEDYPLSQEGQNRFMTDLVSLLLKHEACTGLFWWWPEYNAKGTSLQGWYNYALVDSNNGKISPALATMATFAGENDFVPGGGEGDDPGIDDPSGYPDFYLLYNESDDWHLPGLKMESDGEGLYKVSNVFIEGKGGGDGWFALTTSGATDWTTVNANRYGPPVNDTMIVLDMPFEAEKKESSWQIACGAYDLLFDFNAMQLTVSAFVEGDDEDVTGIGGIGADFESVVYFNLQGIRVANPSRGVFIRVSGSESKLVRL